MKPALRYFLFLLLGLLFIGQQCRSQQSARKEAPVELLQHWFHSYEEDHDSVKIYRPEGFDFPLSRGRTGFAFLKEGKFEQYDIAPTDGLEKSFGEWTWQANGLVQVQLKQVRVGRPTSFQFKIVSISKDRLTLHLP